MTPHPPRRRRPLPTGGAILLGRPLGLVVLLLLLELPELGLDGHRRLLGLRGPHVDVKVLGGDVLLGSVWGEGERQEENLETKMLYVECRIGHAAKKNSL